MDYSSLLEEVLEAWHDARLGFRDEASNIPDEHWDFRPSAEVKSVRELVVHVLEASFFSVGELARPDTNLRRAPFPELVKMYAQRAHEVSERQELLNLLEIQLDEGIATLQEAGELHMLQLIERFDGKPGTRLAWFNHAVAHEMYHRGQLATYARTLGLVPALTKMIHGSSDP